LLIQQSVEKLRRETSTATSENVEEDLNWLARSLDDLRARCMEILRELGGVPELHRAILKIGWDAAEHRRLVANRKTQTAMVQLDDLSEKLILLSNACREIINTIALNAVQGRQL
jgi:hypothetical protein